MVLPQDVDSLFFEQAMREPALCKNVAVTSKVIKFFMITLKAALKYLEQEDLVKEPERPLLRKWIPSACQRLGTYLRGKYNDDEGLDSDTLSRFVRGICKVCLGFKPGETSVEDVMNPAWGMWRPTSEMWGKPATPKPQVPKAADALPVKDLRIPAKLTATPQASSSLSIRSEASMPLREKKSPLLEKKAPLQEKKGSSAPSRLLTASLGQVLEQKALSSSSSTKPLLKATAKPAATLKMPSSSSSPEQKAQGPKLAPGLVKKLVQGLGQRPLHELGPKTAVPATALQKLVQRILSAQKPPKGGAERPLQVSAMKKVLQASTGRAAAKKAPRLGEAAKRMLSFELNSTKSHNARLTLKEGMSEDARVDEEMLLELYEDVLDNTGEAEAEDMLRDFRERSWPTIKRETVTWDPYMGMGGDGKQGASGSTSAPIVVDLIDDSDEDEGGP